MGKCPHCGSRRIRRRYRDHRRYKWRCRDCNRVFRRPRRRGVWFALGVSALVALVAIGGWWFITQSGSVNIRPLYVKPIGGLVTPSPSESTRIGGAALKEQATRGVDVPISSTPGSDALSSNSTPTSVAPSTPTSEFNPANMAKGSEVHTPTPTQIPGRPELYENIPLPNHMGSVQWNWDDGGNGFLSMEIDFTVHNDIDIADVPPDTGLYLMLGLGEVSGTGYYFGLQVDHGNYLNYDPMGLGHGRRVIFSRWETRDLANVRVPENGYTESAGYEGDFVSVRRQYRWRAGEYRMRIASDGEDDEGIWFSLWITEKSTNEATWCGSLKFPHKEGKAAIAPYGITVSEVYGASTTKPIDIPEWHVSVKKPVADGDSSPTRAYVKHANYDDRASVPNSNISFNLEEGSLHFYVGGATERRTEEGWVDIE